MKHIDVQVNAIRDITSGVREFYFVSSDGSALPAYTPGAHINIEIPGIGPRHYSLVFPWEKGNGYTIAAQREDKGRGGSRWLHENLSVGTRISIGAPRNNFPLVDDASFYLLIAGGIGVTPLLCMAMHLQRAGRTFKLLASARTWDRLPYRQQLESLVVAEKAAIAIDGGDPAEGLNIESVMTGLADDVHVYCCGPNLMMERVRTAPTPLPSAHVHFEAFSAAPVQSPAPATEFDVAINGKIIHIAADESILTALTKNGIEVDSSCAEGYCGTCLTRYSAGSPIHRDTVMSDE